MDMLDESLERYYNTTLKFNYFILSTTIVILGLSIKLISPSHSDLWPSLVFVSWAFLLSSFLVGIVWQTSWIKSHEYIHNSILEHRIKGNYPPLNKKLAYYLGISWVVQITFFIVGILLTGIFKVVNFYFGN